MIQQIFDQQTLAYEKQPFIPYEQRIKILFEIEQLLYENEDRICEAISRDFGHRSHHETRLFEITGCVMGLRYARKNLKKWMRPQKRSVPMLFQGAKNRVLPQAKGIIGIVVANNYPLFLAVSPLTSAIAAGNRAMIKLAAHSQALSELLHEKFSQKISTDLICFLPETDSSAFSALPFDHLMFTGSPRVGKQVMKTASNQLVPVTLELGGKSPTILADDFDLQTAAERIMMGKLINAGQTCVAPDYLFMPESKIDDFIQAATAIVQKRYPGLDSRDYTSILDQKGFQRLIRLLEDAGHKNAVISHLLPGPWYDKDKRKAAPAIITRVTPEMALMKEEIFGPLLPVMPYQTLEQVIAYINRHDRPLALYAFSNNTEFIDRLMTETISGGVTVNDCGMHVAQSSLPFGGIGNSGMGQYHGYDGFVEFSKLKPVFTQAKRPLSFSLPFGRMTDLAYTAVKKFKWIKG